MKSGGCTWNRGWDAVVNVIGQALTMVHRCVDAQSFDPLEICSNPSQIRRDRIRDVSRLKTGFRYANATK